MKNHRNVLIFFASIAPAGISRKRAIQRTIDYSQSLEIISKYATIINLDVIVVENTLNSIHRWHELGIYFDDNLKFKFLNENSGACNKGIGELDMALAVQSEFDLGIYERVIWFSGRHLLTTENSLSVCLKSSSDIVVSNPDFFFIEKSRKVITEKNGLLNDMLFAMKSSIFQLYLHDFSQNRNNLIINNIGSEQTLYKFVESNKLSIDWMLSLGVLRRENITRWRWFEDSEWHFC